MSRGRCSPRPSSSCVPSGARQALAVAVVLIVSLGGVSVGRAADVDEVRWGFDGRVLSGRFNILSVRVRNNTPEAYDGVFRLRKTIGAATPVDAPIEEPVFVSPHSERWVQFTVFVTGGYENWELFWSGRPGGRMSLNQPRPGPKARVMLDSLDTQVSSGGGMKRFSEGLFPPSVTALDALDMVVLDHVPRWEESRRQAFLDWLALGGKVHLLHDVAGKFPQFSGDMAVLNAPLEVTRHGAGTVFRHPVARVEVDLAKAKELFQFEITEDEANPTNFYEEGLISYDGGSMFGSGFLPTLKTLTQPEHNWMLLHLLGWCYLVVVFPGCWLVGQWSQNYRLVFGALLAGVALFSLIFLVVGRRGYGETTTANAVAVARALPGDAYDVSQWSNAFVTSGGDYLIRHDGTGVAYSTCQQNEAVNGGIRNGADGAFLVDIPPFSGRDFAHRVRVAAPVPELRVLSVDVTGNQLAALSVGVRGELPPGRAVAYWIHGDSIYQVKGEGAELTRGAPLGKLAGFLRLDQNQRYFTPFGAAEKRDPEETFRSMHPLLIAKSLDLRKAADAESFALPPHLVQLCWIAPQSEAFFIKNWTQGKQQGQAVYTYLIPLNVTETP